jgi:hypothetical protein
MMNSHFGFSDDVSKDCFSDDVKTAIYPFWMAGMDSYHWVRFHV